MNQELESVGDPYLDVPRAVQRELRKQCSWCKDWKPLSDFHKEKAKPLGLQSRCRFCKKLEKKNQPEPVQGQ